MEISYSVADITRVCYTTTNGPQWGTWMIHTKELPEGLGAHTEDNGADALPSALLHHGLIDAAMADCASRETPANCAGHGIPRSAKSAAKRAGLGT